APLAANAANAAVSYGGVRVVDSAGDPVAHQDVMLFGVHEDPENYPSGDTYISFTNLDGVAKFGTGNAPLVPASLSFFYQPIGEDGVTYTWTGGSALMPDFVGEAPAANFSPTST